jgi:hypothetical protein
MPRFFFHLRKQDRELTDREGRVLTDASMAREIATRSMQDFLQQSSGCVDPEWRAWSLTVCDERGRCAFTMDFATAATLATRGPSVPGTHQPLRLAYLDVERRRRDHEMVERRRRQLTERAMLLRDQNRYAVNSLYCMIQRSLRVRDRAQQLLARSRQQSLGEPVRNGLQSVNS